MPIRVRRISRRSAIRAVLTAMATGLTAGAVAAAPEKLSQPEAEYQDSPKDIRMCATCTQFLPPKACKVVAGDVSPNGWCKLFELAD